tara:strand:- start:56 stop:460 length:405 start_codon:yes stop_codon:yes gene_type:complete
MSINLPTPRLPKALDLPTINLKQPSARIPSYKPMVIPPADLERPEETQAAEEKEEKTEQPEPPKLKIPVIDIQLPIPTVEVVAVASYAAVSAVVVTTFAEPVSKGIKKKVQKFLQGKVDKWKEKRKKKKDSSES